MIRALPGGIRPDARRVLFALVVQWPRLAVIFEEMVLSSGDGCSGGHANYVLVVGAPVVDAFI